MTLHKKLISLFTMFALTAVTCVSGVSAYAVSDGDFVNGCTVKEVIFEDDFENGADSDYYKLYPFDNVGKSLDAENGKLFLRKSGSSSGYAACNILPMAGEYLDEGYCLFEFDISKPEFTRAYIWLSNLQNPSGSASVDFARLRYTDRKFFDDKSKNILECFDGEHHVAILADVTGGRYFVSVDGKMFVEGSDALYEPAGGINALRLILPDGSGNTEVSVDNLRVSRVELTDALSVETDFSSLTYERIVRIAHSSGDITKVCSDLNLPLMMPGGSSVTWQSSDESLIGTDGTVYADDSMTKVILTATLTKGSIEKTKEFEFTVTGADDKINDLFYDVEETLLEDSFDDGKTGSNYILYPGNAGNAYGTLSEKDGELQLRWNNTNASSTYFRIVPALKPLTSGIYSIDFDIKKSGDFPVAITLEGNDSGYDIARFRMVNSKFWDEGEGADKYAPTSDGFFNHISILVDTDAGYYYVVADGKEYVYRSEGIYDIRGIRGIKIALDGGLANHCVSVDNLRVCRVDADKYIDNQSKMRIYADSDAITETFICSDPDRVTTSLNLVSKAPNGSSVTWKSSDTSVIDNTGRVTRPMESEEDKDVTLTATFAHGSDKLVKTYNLRVLADEKFTDPGIMSDEEFFGVWDSQKGDFSLKGKIDYSYSADLSKIFECVKKSDYSGAKTELLEYFRNRTPKSTININKRNLLAANLYADGWLFSEHNYYTGEMYAGDEFAPVEGDILTSNLIAGDCNSLIVAPWYNEASWCEIYGTDAVNKAFRPKLVLKVDGRQREYEAVDDAVIRAGSYMESHYEPGSEILRIRKFGKYLSDEEYNVLLKFNLKDLSTSAKIESAKLVLYCRTDIHSPNGKRLHIMREPSNGWNGNTVEWRNVNGFIYNNAGLEEGRNWDQWAPHCNTEYGKQVARFAPMQSTAIEYQITQDEHYAYNTIKALGDFINDFGAWVPTPEPETFGNFSPIEDNTVRGQYPRTLDTCGRLKSICNVFDILCRSESMSPEYSTAILKHTWDIAHSLRAYHCIKFHNWQMIEMQSMYTVANAFPEFTDCEGDDGEDWKNYGYATLANYLLVGYLDDGAYAEDTGGYSQNVLKSYTDIAQRMEKDGYVMDEKAKEKMHNATYYNLLLRTPNGSMLGYGDEPQRSWSTGAEMYSAFSDLFDDPELKYIDSFGRYGTEPSWTSRHFPLGKTTFMRSDWSTNSPYMFSVVRGHVNPSHSHYDDNQVIVYAYGNTLLSDQGTFNYDSTPERIWGRSAEGHNTVTVNDANQMDDVVNGEIHHWTANENFDFLSQSSYATEGTAHRRSIFFAKPSYSKVNYWIVSDLMNPQNDSVENVYKQHWHMRPDANYSSDADKRQIYSDFDKGGNIVVASADGNDVTQVTEDGYWSIDYGNVMPTKWGYFTKKAVGDTTLNTVLVPYENGSASVNAQRVDTGVEASTATALKIDVEADGEKSTDYYYISYEENPQKRNFSSYSTDGRTAFVSTDKSGNIKLVTVSDGSYVTHNGKVLIKTDNKVSDISVEISDGIMYVCCSEDIEPQRIIIGAEFGAKTVYLNGKKTAFSSDDGVFNLSGFSNVPDMGFSGNGVVDRGDENDKDNSDDDKPMVKPSAGGSSSGGGFGGGGFGSGGNVTSPTLQTAVFDDVSGHWAESVILSLYKEGIINGKTERLYCPDDNLTRAEAAALISRVLDLKPENNHISYADVSEGDWFYDAVNTCRAYGIISDDLLFRPNDKITRQEITKLIVGVYELKKGEAPTQELKFSDNSEIASWAREYVGKAVCLGLINGMDDGSFAPLKNATRAEAAMLISRLRTNL